MHNQADLTIETAAFAGPVAAGPIFRSAPVGSVTTSELAFLDAPAADETCLQHLRTPAFLKLAYLHHTPTFLKLTYLYHTPTFFKLTHLYLTPTCLKSTDVYNTARRRESIRQTKNKEVYAARKHESRNENDRVTQPFS